MLKSIEKGNTINAIAYGSQLKGDLITTGDVRIDGHLQGTIKTEGRLVVGEKGVVDGQAHCKNAIIAGELKASITTTDLLTLKSTSKLSGEIIANQLAIEPGAIFSGKCNMGPVVKNISETGVKSKITASEKSA